MLTRHYRDINSLSHNFIVYICKNIFCFDTQMPTCFSRGLSIFERKILRRIHGPIREGEQWRKRYNRELEELHKEPNIVIAIKSSRLRRAVHVVRMEDNDLAKTMLWTNRRCQRGRGWPKSRWIDGVQEEARKMGFIKWRADVQDRGRWRHFLEEAKAHPGL